MDTATDQKLTKFHLSLNVSDLARSINFYQQLFATPAAKVRADYAKFELDDPPLVLSLEPAGASGRGGALNHIGFRLSDAEQLVDLQRRLELSGLSSIREEGVECCYSRQTKFWIQDPDKTLWEFYVLESDSDCANNREASPPVVSLDPRRLRTDSHPVVAESTQPAGELPASADWEHRLGSPFPRPLSFEEQTLNEIRLRGTFNIPWEPAIRDAMLVDCVRVLKPGGRIVLHHLTSNAPLPANSLPLPGPAAVVEEVPVDAELLAAVERAGFCDVQLLKFGSSPSFTAHGVELRETILQAVKSPKADEESILVMYKGPFRELVDDACHTFRRGDRVWISSDAWDRLCSGSLEDSFVRLKSAR